MSILARLANMGDFFGLLLKIKPGHVMEIAEGVQTLADDDADLKERVLAGISVASILVDYTETEADDEFVEFVRDLTESDGVWAIVDAVRELLGGKKVGQLTIVADHPHGVTVGADSEGETKMVPLGVLVQVAVFVVQMIRLMREK